MTAILVALLTLIMAIAHPGQLLTIQHYGDSTTFNEGVVIIAGVLDDNVWNDWCGIETRGTKGFFCNVE